MFLKFPGTLGKGEEHSKHVIFTSILVPDDTLGLFISGEHVWSDDYEHNSSILD